jgi:hypothetical protein
MKMLQLFSSSLLLAVPLMAVAQDSSETLAPEHGHAKPEQVSISYGLKGQADVSGVQFDIPYDSSALKPDLTNCLAGLPDTHTGEFSLCNAIPEKNLIRVVVMDLGRNRILPSGTTLGTIRFERFEGASKARSAPKPVIKNVLLAGEDGQPADVAVDKVFTFGVQ